MRFIAEHAGSVPPMFLSPDDAKTDVILVGAVFVFGRVVQRLASDIPGYPTSGAAALVLNVLWIVVLTSLVAVLLANHRGDRMAAFGLDGPRAAIGTGVVLALPVVGVEVIRNLGAPADWIVLGRLSAGFLPAGGPDPFVILLVIAQLAALAGGSLLAVSFLGVRARDGFPRSPEVPLTQLVRTIGLIAVAGATTLGLLNAGRMRSGAAVLETVLYAIAIAIVLLLVDRHVPAELVVPRATMVAPTVVVVLAHVMATGGLGGVHRGRQRLHRRRGALAEQPVRLSESPHAVATTRTPDVRREPRRGRGQWEQDEPGDDLAGRILHQSLDVVRHASEGEHQTTGQPGRDPEEHACSGGGHEGEDDVATGRSPSRREDHGSEQDVDPDDERTAPEREAQEDVDERDGEHRAVEGGAGVVTLLALSGWPVAARTFSMMYGSATGSCVSRRMMLAARCGKSEPLNFLPWELTKQLSTSRSPNRHFPRPMCSTRYSAETSSS
jgi:hypothetical protein